MYWVVNNKIATTTTTRFKLYVWKILVCVMHSQTTHSHSHSLTKNFLFSFSLLPLFFPPFFFSFPFALHSRHVRGITHSTLSKYLYIYHLSKWYVFFLYLFEIINFGHKLFGWKEWRNEWMNGCFSSCTLFWIKYIKSLK